MRETKVRTANEEERERVIAAIAAGFLADPVVRWCWPDSKQYLTCAPWFISAYGGRAFEHDSAWIDDAVQGGALWLPPGVGPDEEELGKLISTTMREEKQGAILAALEALGAHHPHEPHWFLPLIGVDPMAQGRGIGSALMRRALAKCDETGKRAYLESSNPRNISLYERHGFEVTGEIQIGDGPSFTPMVREPKH